MPPHRAAFTYRWAWKAYVKSYLLLFEIKEPSALVLGITDQRETGPLPQGMISKKDPCFSCKYGMRPGLDWRQLYKCLIETDLKAAATSD